MTPAAGPANHPLNTVAPYYTMFKPEFPLSALEGTSGWVLDPFCGRGTTNFAARLLGLPTVGVDASPVAVAIAAAKLVATTAQDTIDLTEHLIRTHRDAAELPFGEFWRLAYHRETLREICAVRQGLLDASLIGDAAIMLRAVMLGALHGPRGKSVQSYFSNQMPRTYATKPAGAVRYWQAREMTPQYVSVMDIVERRAQRACGGAPPAVRGMVLQADSRKVKLPASVGPFSHVVTSPPYYGMRTYMSDQWLRNWFLGGDESPDYSADRQLDTSSPAAFAKDIAQVWDNVADHSIAGCRLSIRFGAVPSVPSDPKELILDSLERASSDWGVLAVNDAGAADSGRRQAQQFGFVRSKPITEIDVTAILRG